MLAKEALDVLALKAGATPVEIKEAYRDMVKVWHPDRFGSDGRLRQKAEDKLKQINDAYRVLQLEAGTGEAEGGKGSSVHSSSVPIDQNRGVRCECKCIASSVDFTLPGGSADILGWV